MVPVRQLNEDFSTLPIPSRTSIYSAIGLPIAALLFLGGKNVDADIRTVQRSINQLLGSLNLEYLAAYLLLHVQQSLSAQ